MKSYPSCFSTTCLSVARFAEQACPRSIVPRTHVAEEVMVDIANFIPSWADKIRTFLRDPYLPFVREPLLTFVRDHYSGMDFFCS